MTDSVSYTHVSQHSAERFWGVIGKFTEIDWLIGPDNYSVGEHEGHTARLLGQENPIVEYLIGADDGARCLSYGVLKNAFVPVDGYQAEVRVVPAGDGCEATFTSTFELGEVPLDQVTQMLTGAYQMMGQQVDRALGGN